MFKLELNTALLLRTVVVHISTYGGYYLSIKKKKTIIDFHESFYGRA